MVHHKKGFIGMRLRPHTPPKKHTANALRHSAIIIRRPMCIKNIIAIAGRRCHLGGVDLALGRRIVAGIILLLSRSARSEKTQRDGYRNDDRDPRARRQTGGVVVLGVGCTFGFLAVFAGDVVIVRAAFGVISGGVVRIVIGTDRLIGIGGGFLIGGLFGVSTGQDREALFTRDGVAIG